MSSSFSTFLWTTVFLINVVFVFQFCLWPTVFFKNKFRLHFPFFSADPCIFNKCRPCFPLFLRTVQCTLCRLCFPFFSGTTVFFKIKFRTTFVKDYSGPQKKMENEDDIWGKIQWSVKKSGKLRLHSIKIQWPTEKSGKWRLQLLKNTVYNN